MATRFRVRRTNIVRFDEDFRVGRPFVGTLGGEFMATCVWGKKLLPFVNSVDYRSALIELGRCGDALVV